jgi:hypothetical protein
MAEQPPMGTVEQQNAAADAERARLNQQVYDFRKTCDPFVWDHVIAFHQHANTSDEAFATLQADYAKRAAEMLPPPDLPEGEAARRG